MPWPFSASFVYLTHEALGIPPTRRAPIDPQALAYGPRYAFADWPNPDLPRVAAGVYAVWHGEQLLYVGMSGHGLTAADLEQHRRLGRGAKGLQGRLRSHRNGRRGSDQFCLYVFDRLILPSLTPEEIARAADGAEALDVRTRRFIQAHLTYSFVVTADGAEALALERRLRSGAWSVGPPLINPLPQSS